MIKKKENSVLSPIVCLETFVLFFSFFPLWNFCDEFRVGASLSQISTLLKSFFFFIHFSRGIKSNLRCSNHVIPRPDCTHPVHLISPITTFYWRREAIRHRTGRNLPANTSETQHGLRRNRPRVQMDESSPEVRQKGESELCNMSRPRKTPPSRQGLSRPSASHHEPP